MHRRRLAFGLVAFLALLCIGVPVAFHAGWSDGVGRAAFRFDAGASAASGPGQRDFWDCYRQVRLPVLRQFDRMQDCRPPGEGGHARHSAPEVHPYRGSSRLRNGGLSKALAASIAGAGPRIAGYQPEVPAAPLNLAMAPGLTGPLESPASGPFALQPTELPGNLIPPGFGGLVPPENPLDPDGPPPVETPIPGALPLLLTGFLGLAAARRRKAKP